MTAKVQISEHNKIHLFHIFSKIFAKFRYSFYLCAIKQNAMEEKRYPQIEEESNTNMTCEPLQVPADDVDIAMPNDMPYANIVDGKLQITPDIEEEIAEVERGETISMSEFNMMFAKWLD